MPVPKVYLSKDLGQGNFLIPSDDRLRAEEREKLYGYRRMGVYYMPGNAAAEVELDARIAAYDAYDNVHAEAKKRRLKKKAA